MKPSVPYHDLLIEDLKDPDEARAYLEMAIEEFEADGDKEHFLVALRNVTEAQGGIGALAERTNMNRTHLYRALSKDGNPRLDKIGAILHGLGFRLSVELLRPGVGKQRCYAGNPGNTGKAQSALKRSQDINNYLFQ